MEDRLRITGKFKKRLDTRKIAVIILKFEQCGFTIHLYVQKMQTE